MMLYSWQHADYRHLAAQFIASDCSSWLIHGRASRGNDVLLRHLINFALCLNKQGLEPCGKCNACLVYAVNNHPDYYVLSVDDSDLRKYPQIKIEQVRKMYEFTQTSQHLSAYKIIYLPDCGQLNLASANALLKILEEPPTYCRFILQTANINRVLATLRSRCFKYQPQLTTVAVATEATGSKPFWLRYSDGDPLFIAPFDDALLAEVIKNLLYPSIANVFKLSQAFTAQKSGLNHWCEFMLKWLSDLLQVKFGAQASYFYAEELAMRQLNLKLDVSKLFALQQQLLFLYEWSEHPLNQKLQWENILFKYQQLYV